MYKSPPLAYAGRVIVACALAVLAQAAQAGSAEAHAAEARAWIDRMNDALAKRNYDGVFVYHLGGKRQTLRIIHRAQGDHMTERLIFADGSGREILRNGSELRTYYPDRRVVVVEERGRASGFITALYGLTADADKYYVLNSADSPVRARGFTARLVTVLPRDGLRYGYRFWIDEKTGMPVRTQLIAVSGEVLEETSFISITLPDTIDDELLKPDVDATDFHWLRRDTPAPPNSVKTVFVPRIDLLPPGFRVRTGPGQARVPDNAPRSRFIISDGIAWVSVFIEVEQPSAAPAGPPGAAHRGMGLVQMGPSCAFMASVAGHRITVVGEVPAETVTAIAGAVQPQ